MKMFVWKDVLIDYTSGLAVAHARNIAQAKALLIKAGISESNWNGYLLDGQEAQVTPADKPGAAFVYGGG
jgi:hypothetical protein